METGHDSLATELLGCVGGESSLATELLGSAAGGRSLASDLLSSVSGEQPSLASELLASVGRVSSKKEEAQRTEKRPLTFAEDLLHKLSRSGEDNITGLTEVSIAGEFIKNLKNDTFNNGKRDWFTFSKKPPVFDGPEINPDGWSAPGPAVFPGQDFTEPSLPVKRAKTEDGEGNPPSPESEDEDSQSEDSEDSEMDDGQIEDEEDADWDMSHAGKNLLNRKRKYSSRRLPNLPSGPVEPITFPPLPPHLITTNVGVTGRPRGRPRKYESPSMIMYNRQLQYIYQALMGHDNSTDIVKDLPDFAKQATPADQFMFPSVGAVMVGERPSKKTAQQIKTLAANESMLASLFQNMYGGKTEPVKVINGVTIKKKKVPTATLR